MLTRVDRVKKKRAPRAPKECQSYRRGYLPSTPTVNHQSGSHGLPCESFHNKHGDCCVCVPSPRGWERVAKSAILANLWGCPLAVARRATCTFVAIECIVGTHRRSRETLAFPGLAWDQPKGGCIRGKNKCFTHGVTDEWVHRHIGRRRWVPQGWPSAKIGHVDPTGGVLQVLLLGWRQTNGIVARREERTMLRRVVLSLSGVGIQFHVLLRHDKGVDVLDKREERKHSRCVSPRGTERNFGPVDQTPS